jgi:hypothetical protein
MFKVLILAILSSVGMAASAFNAPLPRLSSKVLNMSEF